MGDEASHFSGMCVYQQWFIADLYVPSEKWAYLASVLLGLVFSPTIICLLLPQLGILCKFKCVSEGCRSRFHSLRTFHMVNIPRHGCQNVYTFPQWALRAHAIVSVHANTFPPFVPFSRNAVIRIWIVLSWFPILLALSKDSIVIFCGIDWLADGISPHSLSTNLCKTWCKGRLRSCSLPPCVDPVISTLSVRRFLRVPRNVYAGFMSKQQQDNCGSVEQRPILNS